MIYVECKADEILARSLGAPRRKLVHSGSKGGVCKKLRKSSASLGIVDEDPGSSQPPYLNRLGAPRLNEHGLKVYEDGRTGNVLVVLCPFLEQWVLDAAREARVNPAIYNLPDDGKELHKVVNHRLDKFRKLVEEAFPNSPRLRKLAEVMRKAL